MQYSDFAAVMESDWGDYNLRRSIVGSGGGDRLTFTSHDRDGGPAGSILNLATLTVHFSCEHFKRVPNF